MQDSIEDYLQISENIVKDNILNENATTRKEALATAQRKKEYEAYAMKIVMFLLDGKLRPETFLKCIKYINQDYYQDVVEERAVTKLCGYPLCGKKVIDMPKQKYIISTKANKVYDISERKNFCSNFCYKASLYIKEQIDSSPLWLRNHKDMKDCNLLPANVPGSPGEEIDQGILKPAAELPNFTSVTQFTQISLEEVEEIEKNSKKNEKANVKYKIQKQQSLNVIQEDDVSDNESESENVDADLQENSDNEFDNEYNVHENVNVKLNEKNENDVNRNNINVNNENKKKHIQKQHANFMTEKEKLEHLISRLKINNEPKIKLVAPSPMKVSIKSKAEDFQQLESTSGITKKAVKHTGSNESNSKEDQISTVSEEILREIRTCIHDWITLDTFIYIYGEDKVKHVLNENKMGEYFDKLKITELDRTQQLKYMNICRKLHMQELAETKFDNSVVGYSLKPLPDFKQLKAEVHELDIKVRSFYKGVLYETPDTNFPTKPVKENEAIEEATAVLPPVDVNAQNALRRKVFLSSINKTLKKLIKELKLDETSILSSIRELVKSFKLQAHNIVLKPAGWLLVAIVLIKILSLKDKNINQQLRDQSSVEYLDLIMSKYSGIERIMDDVFIILSDIDKFVESYITQHSDA